MSSRQSSRFSKLTEHLFKYPSLLVLSIVGVSVSLTVKLKLLTGSEIDTATIIVPLIVATLASVLSIQFSRKYVEKSKALASQGELFDQVAESLDFAVDVINDPNNPRERLGAQVHRFLGETTDVQLVFADLLDRIHPDDLATFSNENDRFFSSGFDNDGVFTAGLECRIHRTNNEYRWTRVDRVMQVKQGERLCYVQYSDVQEQIQRRDKLALLAADRADNLVTVSHEIRTPLNAILGLTDLMLATRLTKTQNEYLTKIHGAADALETLVRNLLDLRRLDSGQLKVEPETVVTEDLLDNLVLMHQAVAENSGLRFLVDFSPNLPKRITTDGQMLEQIVNNLLRNAIKFTSEGMVMLSAGFTEQSDTGGVLLIEVSDTGRGIDSHRVDSIFMPFQRGNAENRVEGAGLGLALVKRFCDLLQGEVALTSEVGVGSKFSIRIPVTRLDAHAVIDRVRLEAMSNLKVLLIERRGLSASHICSVIGSWVERVDTVRDLSEALVYLEKTETDVVLVGHVFGLDELEQFVDNCNRQVLAGLKLVAIAKLETMTSRLFSLVAGVVVDPFSLKQFVGIISSENMCEDPLQSSGHSLAAGVNALTLLKNVRVLVAEDNEINQQVISEHLKQHGARVTLVDNGQQAIDALKKSDYDLILMDIEMPVLDGFEASERIKAEPGWKHIPIIAVSAGVTASQKERANLVGMRGFVGKPYKIQELLDTIEAVLVDRDLAPAQTELGFDEAPVGAVSTPEPVKFIEFDFEEASDYWPTDESLIASLRLFVEKYPAAQDLFDNKRDEQPEKLAHTLKGAAGFLGMVRYSKRLNELNLAFKNNTATDDMISDIRAQHTRVLAEVRSFLSMLE